MPEFSINKDKVIGGIKNLLFFSTDAVLTTNNLLIARGFFIFVDYCISYYYIALPYSVHNYLQFKFEIDYN